MGGHEIDSFGIFLEAFRAFQRYFVVRDLR
jgi:hypothetical protein